MHEKQRFLIKKHIFIILTALGLILSLYIINITSTKSIYAYELTKEMEILERDIRQYFKNWKDNPYHISKHNCGHMSAEIERYVETTLGIDCYLIYGVRQISENESIGHVWNVIKINNNTYEFDSTSLQFYKNSYTYTDFFVEEGLYVNGTRISEHIKIEKLVLK